MTSILNPDAPEFYPHLSAVAQEGLKQAGKTIQSSKRMPCGFSYDNFKTFTAFNIITDQLDKNIVRQANKIIATEDQPGLLRNDTEQNIDTIVETNDTMIDRLNINLDELCGINYHSYKVAIAPSTLTSTSNISPWNTTPVITKIRMGSATLIAAKNIPRPQIHFKDPVDNSNSLWKPKITDKPNNIKPLALKLQYDDDGVAVGYEHPYQVELDVYKPKPQLLKASSSPPVLPPPLEETPHTYIDQEDQLDQLVQHLLTVEQMAVDVEHHSYRTYQGITCLIQITTKEGGDFIIDTLALREHMHKLNQAFTDPKIIKIFHGADMDVLWLQRDFGVYLVGLFDTYRAAKALELPGRSLKCLLMKYCQVDADKKYQLADWRMRPLPGELIAYARQDTHYLLYIFQKMRDELLDKSPQLLYSVFEESRQVCTTTYTKMICDEESHLSLVSKLRKTLNTQQMAALKLLYKWRDAQARELDESTAYLLPNHMLFTLAEALPRELEGVHACCSPMPPFVKQNCITIHRMILSCRELPLEPKLYRVPLSINAARNHQRKRPENVHKFHDFTHEQQPNQTDDNPILAETHPCEWELSPLTDCIADITIFKPEDRGDNERIVSQLKPDAKSFVPPYFRYKLYRTLSQIEEVKVFKEKEAKITALSKGNLLIKEEILSQLVSPEESDAKPAPSRQRSEATQEQLDANKTKQRKRKISANSESKIEPSLESTKTIDNSNEHLTSNVKQKSKIKTFDYKEADYKKFYNTTQKLNKIKKTNSKFHKK